MNYTWCLCPLPPSASQTPISSFFPDVHGIGRSSFQLGHALSLAQLESHSPAYDSYSKVWNVLVHLCPISPHGVCQTAWESIRPQSQLVCIKQLYRKQLLC